MSCLDPKTIVDLACIGVMALLILAASVVIGILAWKD